MHYAVIVLTDGSYSCSLFGGFNAACRYADASHESGAVVFVYKNVGFGRVNPYFMLLHKLYDGNRLYGTECPVHLNVIYRLLSK